jgi:thiol:disulfide interchange protein
MYTSDVLIIIPLLIGVILDLCSCSSPMYGFKSEILKVGLIQKPGGNYIVYALSLIFARTLQGPAARGLSLDFFKLGNLSFSNEPTPNH